MSGDRKDDIIAEQGIALAQLAASNAGLSATIQKLTAEISELKRMLFGQSRERVVPVERELRARGKKPKLTPEQRQARRREKRRAQTEARESLLVEDVVHSIDSCPACGGHELASISEKVNEEFEFVSAHYKRIRHRRETKRCKSCDTVSTASGPDRVVDGGHYGPGLYAHAVVAKCADSIPIHRLAKSFERNGIPMSRTTLNALFHRAAELLGPIEKRILELVAASSRVNADETPIHIQAPGKCRTGYVWTFIAEKLVAYVFAASRSGDVPRSVLGDTKGHLQVDAYSGYNVVCVPDGRDRVGCMGHTRRKFFAALETAPKEAATALDFVLQLYEVEYLAAERDIVGTSEHLKLRQTAMAPIFKKFQLWLRDQSPHHLPKGPMGKAIQYALNQWDELEKVLDDAKLRLDNNVAENALRIVALGRKNFLFVGNEQGGRNLATLQTVVSTCNANGVNPEAYIKDVLIRVQNTPSSEIDSLLPNNWEETE
ncbi:MAG: IS66 family transposase [Myxococcota bacterium]